MRHFRQFALISFVLFAALALAQSPPPPITTSQLILPISTQLAPVTSAAVTVVGNPGPQTYCYWAVANYLVGATSPTFLTCITSAPNTLSGSNFIQIIPAYPNGSLVDVLRTNGRTPPTGACNCAVATGVASGAINDQSSSLSSYTVAPFIGNNFTLTIANEVIGSGATHAILRQAGVFVADLSLSASSGIVTGATGSGGLILTGTTLGLLSTCSTSQVLQWTGSAWACANPGAGTVTGATSGGGLLLTGSTLGLSTSCSSGQVLQWTGLAWACVTPTNGTVTGVTGGSGLALTGTTVGMLATCSNGQVLQWNGSAWVCATIASGGVTGSGTASTLPLWSGSTALGNSPVTVSGGTVAIADPVSVSGNVSASSFTGVGALEITSGIPGSNFSPTPSESALVIQTDGNLYFSNNGGAFGQVALGSAITQNLEAAGNASNAAAPYLFTYNTAPNTGADRGAVWRTALASSFNGVSAFEVDARPEIAANIAVNSNALSGTGGGHLLLPPGTINVAVGQQMPTGANGLHVIGEGNSNVTTIAACASGVAGCASDMTRNPAGQVTAVIGMGPTTPTNAVNVVGSSFEYVTVDTNGVPGVMGDAVTAGQEMTEHNHLNIKNSALVQFDIGEGTTSVQNGGRLHDFYFLLSPTQPVYNPCPVAVIPSISTISNNTSNVATVTLSGAPTPALQPFMEVDITGQSNGATHGTVYNGLWEIASVISSTSFTYNLKAGSVSDSATGNGTVQTGPIGIRAFSAPNTGGRPISNGTIVAAGCTAFTIPLIDLSLSGGPWDATNLHLEEAQYPVTIGTDGPTKDIHLSHISAVTNDVNGVLISNQYSVSNTDIDMLITTQGGGTPNTTSLIDQINGNTLTPTNNGHLSHYWLDSASYPWTTANPVGGTEIANGFDFYNGTFSIYNAGVLEFSANNSGALTLATPLAVAYGGTGGSSVPACATCVTSAAALTSTALMTGGGSRASQTPSATSTLSSSGVLNVAAGGSIGSADTGSPSWAFAAALMTANQPVAFLPTARSSGVLPYWKITIPTDTGLTAGTEAPGILGVTATRTWATTGTIALQREIFFPGPTYASASASQTFTDAFNLYLTPPIAGANAVFTRGHTLGIVDSTNSAGPNTGAVVISTTLGTPASSVGIGNGNISAGGKISASSTFALSSVVFASATAPTIASGFGTSPSIVHSNGTAAFTVNVGTGGSATSGVLTMPTATTGWACNVTPNGAPQAAAVTYSAPTSTTSVTLTNYTESTAATLAWTASFVLQVTCVAY